MPPVLAHLPADRAAEVGAVLSDAFYDYPVMRFVVGTGHADFDARLRALVDYFVFRRMRLGAPMLGVLDGDHLVAAAVMTLPIEPAAPDDVTARRDSLWRAIGDDARERYDTYSTVAKRFAIQTPHHHLNMIGTRRARAGTGLARPLLDEVARLSRDDSGSSGVSLTTEVEKNVTLYEHFGYRVVGHARVSPDMETWGMYLATK
jgi:hypothetical protein